MCSLCHCETEYKYHCLDCSKNRGVAIKAHDLMVNYLISKLSKHHARKVCAKNHNLPNLANNNGEIIVPDIVMRFHDKTLYLDVGISHTPQ